MISVMREHPLVPPGRSPLVATAAIVAVLAALLFGAPPAHAAYGEYKVLLTEAYEAGPHTIGAQLAAFPEIKEIDYADTAEVVPSETELAKYDAVVSVGDSSYKHSIEWGNALATYVDGGGVVVQSAYDTWEGITNGFGRFESGGYQALLLGKNANESVSLATVDPASPLMVGVGALTSTDNTNSPLGTGAAVVATWTNGAPAVAFKGRVVDISAFLGDGYGTPPPFTGDFGRIIFNAVRMLGPQPPVVVPPVAPAPVVPVPSNAIKLGKLKLNEQKGTGVLSITVPGAGSLVMSGKGLKKATKVTAAAGSVNLPVKLTGRAKKALLELGKAKVKAALSFTPTGGTAGTKEKSLTLKKTLG